MKTNLNNNIHFKLTHSGEKLIEHLRQNKKTFYFPEPKKNGIYTLQLWVFSEIFGSYFYNGCDAPVETEIEIDGSN